MPLGAQIVLSCMALAVFVVGTQVAHSATSLVVMLGVVMVLLFLAAPSSRTDRPAPPLAADVPTRSRPVDHSVWNVVRHLNSYRNADPSTLASVHHLLWTLASTDPDNVAHSRAVQALAEHLAGWTQRSAVDLTNAASALRAS